MMLYFYPILAIIIGTLFVLLTKNKGLINTKLLLAFSGAFLLAITLFELLPEVYHHLDAKLTGILIMTGIVIQIFLESLSKGAEHGHLHIHKHSTAFPWLLFISLCIHSILEGFPIHHDNSIVFGIFIHKIPIAILITSFLLEAKYSKLQTVLFIVVFALMTPLGTFLSNTMSWLADYLDYINAIVIGIFLHIATIILFESSEGHKFNLTKLFTIVLGVIIAYFV